MLWRDGEQDPLIGVEKCQAVMDRELGCKLLPRLVFNTQNDISGLLEVRLCRPIAMPVTRKRCRGILRYSAGLGSGSATSIISACSHVYDPIAHYY